MVKALNERKPSMLRLRHKIEPATRYYAVSRVACLEVGMGDFGLRPCRCSADTSRRLPDETIFAKEAKI